MGYAADGRLLIRVFDLDGNELDRHPADARQCAACDATPAAIG
jgi:hypothetical protein